MLAEVQWESVALVAALAAMSVGIIRIFRSGKDPDAVIRMIERTAQNTERNAAAISALTTNVAVLSTKLENHGLTLDEVRRTVQKLEKHTEG